MSNQHTPPRQAPTGRIPRRHLNKRARLTRETIVQAIRRAARKRGHSPSGSELFAETGIRRDQARRCFGSWHGALRAAGCKPRFRNEGIDVVALLEDWGRVARRLRRLPRTHEYQQRGTYSSSALLRRFGSWRAIPGAFQAYCGGNADWADLLPIIKSSAGQRLRGRHARLNPDRDPRFDFARTLIRRHPDRPVCGNPMDFRGVRHEPNTENGVILLFGAVARDLGFLVQSVRVGFPDCDALREVAPGQWQRVSIEFELESRHFFDQGHPVEGCDIIVCWRHNWPECPLEVIELARLTMPVSP